MTVLKVQDARRRYDEVQALDGVSLESTAGRIIGLLGPNGAGKSTLIRSITTLERLDSGNIEICGKDVASEPAAARRHLGYAGQESAVDKVMTGREFLRFQAGLVHLAKADIAPRVDEMLTRLDLQDAADRLVEGYSGGMKRRLDLAASLMHRPELLILDEPSTGLDYDARRRLWNLLRSLRDDGASLLLATHDFEEAAELCDRVVLLHKGRVAADGSPEALRQQLGSWVLSASLHEHPQPGDADRLTPLFHGIPGTRLPQDPRRAEVDHILPPGEHDSRAAVDAVHKRAREHDMELFSVALRQPTLQDVYRSCVGELDPNASGSEQSSGATQ